VTRTPGSFMPGSLAYVVPNAGSHITVFLDRIEEMRAPSNVLAHVMVHEITHLLQGVGRHSASGVMKEVWSARDFGWMRIKPLSFTPVDVELIYASLEAGRSFQVASSDQNARAYCTGAGGRSPSSLAACNGK
jgi:hypothetical protein